MKRTTRIINSLVITGISLSLNACSLLGYNYYDRLTGRMDTKEIADLHNMVMDEHDKWAANERKQALKRHPNTNGIPDYSNAKHWHDDDISVEVTTY